jgi:hypothetical protein
MRSPEPPYDLLLFDTQLPLISVEGKTVVRYIAVLAPMTDLSKHQRHAKHLVSFDLVLELQGIVR